MPELPEVETIARTLAPQIVGRSITGITTLHPKVVQAGAALLPLLLPGEGKEGWTIARVFRRAKLLLISLSPSGAALSGVEAPAQTSARIPPRTPEIPAGTPAPAEELLLAFHLKMTGSFFVHPPHTGPLRHTRLILDLSDRRRLFFDDMRTFGYCRAMLPGDLLSWPFWAGLGPEPLDMEARELAGHLAAAAANRKISIKAALLNQEIIAGVGNIYADESLFLAGIRPTAKASALSAEQFPALAHALQRVLRRAIKECGSSIRNYRDAQGNAGAFQNSFAVYGRKGECCARCQSPLTAAKVAGRGTVYCPVCQQ